MTNYQTGHSAEVAASEYLKQQNFKILELNWKTKYCEIDIVAQKHKAIYFVEVKYRKTAAYGSGLEYITPKKLAKMNFAAEMWVSQHGWRHDYQLSVIKIDGASGELSFLINL